MIDDLRLSHSAECSKPIFTGGVVTASGSCSAAFCESAALRGAPSPSQPHCARQLSQRESPWQSTHTTSFAKGSLHRKKGIAKPPQVFRYPELIRSFCAQRKHHCAGTSFLRSRSLMPAGHIIPFLPGLPPGLPQRRQRPLPPWRQAARRWVLPLPRKHRSARSVPRRRGRCVPVPSPCRSHPDA